MKPEGGGQRQKRNYSKRFSHASFEVRRRFFRQIIKSEFIRSFYVKVNEEEGGTSLRLIKVSRPALAPRNWSQLMKKTFQFHRGSSSVHLIRKMLCGDLQRWNRWTLFGRMFSFEVRWQEKVKWQVQICLAQVNRNATNFSSEVNITVASSPIVSLDKLIILFLLLSTSSCSSNFTIIHAPMIPSKWR